MVDGDIVYRDRQANAPSGCLLADSASGKSLADRRLPPLQCHIDFAFEGQPPPASLLPSHTASKATKAPRSVESLRKKRRRRNKKKQELHRNLSRKQKKERHVEASNKVITGLKDKLKLAQKKLKIYRYS